MLTPLWRSVRLVEHLLRGAIIALTVVVAAKSGRRVAWLPDRVAWWHGRLIRVLGIRVEVQGVLAAGALLVANHVSWLDIPVIGAQGRIGFLSKAEVRRWPLIGWMATIAGTLFLARGAHQTGEMIRRIEERLQAGDAIVIFPEGTTTDGTRLQRFYPTLLAAGQSPGIRVQPVALRFGASTVPDSIAPFVGDDALLPHLGRLLRHPGVRVQLHFLPPLDGSGLSRRAIAERCRLAIARALGIEESAPASFTAAAQARPAPRLPPAEAA